MGGLFQAHDLAVGQHGVFHAVLAGAQHRAGIPALQLFAGDGAAAAPEGLGKAAGVGDGPLVPEMQSRGQNRAHQGAAAGLHIAHAHGKAGGGSVQLLRCQRRLIGQSGNHRLAAVAEPLALFLGGQGRPFFKGHDVSSWGKGFIEMKKAEPALFAATV